MAVEVTENKTRVLDPGADTAPMVVVYRGLGPEMGKAYAYDTADWMIDQIQKALPKEMLNRIIFAVPDDYNHDCDQCIKQATAVIEKRGGKVGIHSLCGFSKGGAPVYRNLSRRPWQIVGLIDAVSPSMEGHSDKIVDGYSAKIRCIYGVSHWGPKPPKDKSPNSYSRGEKVYTKAREFYDHLKSIGAKITDGDTQGHAEMPGLFFRKYGADFL